MALAEKIMEQGIDYMHNGFYLTTQYQGECGLIALRAMPTPFFFLFVT